MKSVCRRTTRFQSPKSTTHCSIGPFLGQWDGALVRFLKVWLTWANNYLDQLLTLLTKGMSGLP